MKVLNLENQINEKRMTMIPRFITITDEVMTKWMKFFENSLKGSDYSNDQDKVEIKQKIETVKDDVVDKVSKWEALDIELTHEAILDKYPKVIQGKIK